MKRLITALVFLTVTLWIVLGFGASVMLEWDRNDPAEEIQAYYIHSLKGTNWLVIGKTTNTSFQVTGLEPGRYTFALTASNFWKESPLSFPVSTPDLPKNPTNIIIVIIQR